MKPKERIVAWALNSSMARTEMIEVRTDGRRYNIRSIVLPEEVYGRERTPRDMAWCKVRLVRFDSSTKLQSPEMIDRVYIISVT